MTHGDKDISGVNKPTCSLVIRCFNEEMHIGKLLEGVMMQTLKYVEIIVVDSGSTDSTLSIASKYPVKIFHIRPEEFSFGRALNVGCAAATTEYIVIASAHVYPVYMGWLENIIEPFKDPDVAFVYGKQRGDANAKYSEQMIYKKWYPDESTFNQGHPFCNNANSAIRRSLWKTYPFNEELTGLEDLDWAKRAVELGKKIAYSAKAEIIHVHNESPVKIYNRYKREAIAFHHIFPHEHFLFTDFLRLFTGNFLSDCYHAIHDRMFFKNFSKIIMFRFMQFWGTYRGFSQRGSVSQHLRNRFYYPNGFERRQEVVGDVKGEKERAIKYDHH